jgi:hypothetical protein
MKNSVVLSHELEPDGIRHFMPGLAPGELLPQVTDWHLKNSIILGHELEPEELGHLRHEMAPGKLSYLRSQTERNRST